MYCIRKSILVFVFWENMAYSISSTIEVYDCSKSTSIVQAWTLLLPESLRCDTNIKVHASRGVKTWLGASLRLTRRPTRVLIITTSRGISFGWMKSPKMVLEEAGWGGRRAAFSKSSYLVTQFASAGCLRLKSQCRIRVAGARIW